MAADVMSNLGMLINYLKGNTMFTIENPSFGEYNVLNSYGAIVMEEATFCCGHIYGKDSRFGDSKTDWTWHVCRLDHSDNLIDSSWKTFTTKEAARSFCQREDGKMWEAALSENVDGLEELFNRMGE